MMHLGHLRPIGLPRVLVRTLGYHLNKIPFKNQETRLLHLSPLARTNQNHLSNTNNKASTDKMATLITPLNFTPRTHFKTQLPIKFPSQQRPFSISFSHRQNNKHLVCNTVPRCSSESRDSFEDTGAYPRPSEVQWNKEICNSVQLVGTVGLPVELKHLSSGKVVGSTSLAVWKSPTETSWINLIFWDEMAHIAHQHVQKGNRIYVSGRLRADTVESEDGMQKTYYKVVVQQLNFVERSSPSPVSSYDESYSSTASAAKSGNSAPPSKLSTQELWQAFFANPTEWWDNRNTKRNPKAPDFKHKDTGEALWVEDRYNPPWVKSQLEILDSRMQFHQKQDEPGLFSYLNGGL